MFNSVFLDVFLGMVFIFLLYSLLVTALQEFLATLFKLRARYLLGAVRQMLSDRHFGEGLAEAFRSHPLIRKITFTGQEKLPSYISDRTFVQVVKDILPDVYTGRGERLTLVERVALLPEGELKKTLTTYLRDEGATIDSVLAEWFATTMERVSGAYKRRTQYLVFLLGFAVAFSFNVDALAVFKTLSSSEKARAAVVAQAQAFAEANQDYDSLLQRFRSRADSLAALPTTPATDSLRALARSDSLQALMQRDTALLQEWQRQRGAIQAFIRDDLGRVNNALGIGWKTTTIGGVLDEWWQKGFWSGLAVLAGWVLTALAVTIGAPFWFDLLQKLVRIRGTGRKPPYEHPV